MKQSPAKYLLERRTLLCLCVTLMTITPSFARAEGGPALGLRPLDDFLAAQGTTTQFVPPVSDYVGWADDGLINFALIDYAGLANEYLEAESGGAISLGTHVGGTVFERQRPDGRAAVRVRLVTRNALAWAFAIADADFENDPLPFLNTPLAFGARAQDVLEGATPALGVTFLDARFANSAPDAPLPDLVQLFNAPQPEQLPLRFTFRALAPGTDADGELALLDVRQRCRGELNDEGGAVITCSREVVDIRSPGNS